MLRAIFRKHYERREEQRVIRDYARAKRIVVALVGDKGMKPDDPTVLKFAEMLQRERLK